MTNNESEANQIVAATIVDELVRNGVSVACLSPGSRSTPLALALLRSSEMKCQVLLDERSSGFFALGSAKVSKNPVVVLTTSGTAAAELSPAVVEASQSGVSLIIITADRPLELYGTGSAQTIDQTQLYAGYLRSRRLFDAGSTSSHAWLRSIISRLVLESRGTLSAPGPVHLNVSFREPLITANQTVPNVLTAKNKGPWYQVFDFSQLHDTTAFAELLLTQKRGLLIVGETNEPEAAYVISELLGWPTLVDARSPIVCRSTYSVSHHDTFVRIKELAHELEPSFVLYLGRPQASKALASFIGTNRELTTKNRVLVFSGSPAGFDPDGSVDGYVVGSMEHLVTALSRLEVETNICQEPNFTNKYLTYDRIARSVIEKLLQNKELGTEIALMYHVLNGLGPTDLLFVSASMPLRDLENFGTKGSQTPQVFENRGVNGIDGILATFAGVMNAKVDFESDSIAVLIAGDLAFLYDVSFLREFGQMVGNALIVVIDNNGGGIFSFLAQRKLLSDVEFEKLFGTPHNIDLGALITGFGIEATCVDNADQIPKLIAEQRQCANVRVAVVKSDRNANLQAHDYLYNMIEESILDSLR